MDMCFQAFPSLSTPSHILVSVTFPSVFRHQPWNPPEKGLCVTNLLDCIRSSYHDLTLSVWCSVEGKTKPSQGMDNKHHNKFKAIWCWDWEMAERLIPLAAWADNRSWVPNPLYEVAPKPYNSCSMRIGCLRSPSFPALTCTHLHKTHTST